MNTYDNTIVYMDQFIDKVIKKLEQRDDLESAVLYVSDYGESLGKTACICIPHLMELPRKNKPKCQ